tara:strand:- start:166 stop:459 length:294 start_codon:yes stop_codon:yes gene_type:complete
MVQGLRLANTTAPQVAAMLGLGLGIPALLANWHGRSAGYADPSRGGLGGTIGYGLLTGTPLAGIAYGQGHQAGRNAATVEMLGGNPNTINWERLPGT